VYTVRDKKKYTTELEFHAHAFITICNVFVSGKRFTTTYWLDKRLEKPIDTTRGCVTYINLNITDNEQLD